MRISILALFLLSCNIIVLAQSVDKSKLNNYFHALENNNKFIGTVSVFRSGEEIYAKSIGFSDVDKQIIADKQTKYIVGSISKTFTAVMIFQAIEGGELSLHQTIEKYFPSIKNSNTITIKHLLGHRSGIHNFTDDEFFQNEQTLNKTKAHMIEIIEKGGSDFEPGSKFQYSNSNYVLLSYILESVYKNSYAKIFSKNITKPLSLSNTYLGLGKKLNQ